MCKPDLPTLEISPKTLFAFSSFFRYKGNEGLWFCQPSSKSMTQVFGWKVCGRGKSDHPKAIRDVWADGAMSGWPCQTSHKSGYMRSLRGISGRGKLPGRPFSCEAMRRRGRRKPGAKQCSIVFDNKKMLTKTTTKWKNPISPFQYCRCTACPIKKGC